MADQTKSLLDDNSPYPTKSFHSSQSPKLQPNIVEDTLVSSLGPRVLGDLKQQGRGLLSGDAKVLPLSKHFDNVRQGNSDVTMIDVSELAKTNPTMRNFSQLAGAAGLK